MQKYAMNAVLKKNAMKDKMGKAGEDADPAKIAEEVRNVVRL